MSRDYAIEENVKLQSEIRTLKDEKKSLAQMLAAKDAEIERLKAILADALEWGMTSKHFDAGRSLKNGEDASAALSRAEQGTTQYCREALDAHKEADAMRADAALGAAVRKEIAELEHKRDNDCILSDIEDEWLNDLQTLVAEAGLMKGEER